MLYSVKIFTNMSGVVCQLSYFNYVQFLRDTSGSTPTEQCSRADDQVHTIARLHPKKDSKEHRNFKETPPRVSEHRSSGETYAFSRQASLTTLSNCSRSNGPESFFFFWREAFWQLTLVTFLICFSRNKNFAYPYFGMRILGCVDHGWSWRFGQCNIESMIDRSCGCNGRDIVWRV